MSDTPYFSLFIRHKNRRLIAKEYIKLIKEKYYDLTWKTTP